MTVFLRVCAFFVASITIFAAACSGPGSNGNGLPPANFSGLGPEANLASELQAPLANKRTAAIRKRKRADVISGCQIIDWSGDVYAQPTYTTTSYTVGIELPSTLPVAPSPGYEVDWSANQEGQVESGSYNALPGDKRSITLTFNLQPCQSASGMSFSNNVYYPGGAPEDTGSATFVTVTPTPPPSPTPTPTAKPTPTPGNLTVYPATIDYPKKGAKLGGLGCSYGNQPYIPGSKSEDDPDFVMTDNIKLGTGADGCELFNKQPVDQLNQPSIHVNEPGYHGVFSVSGTGMCDPSLGGPTWWKGDNVGPSAYLELWGKITVPSTVSCTITITGFKGSPINVTVRPGT